MGAHQSFIHSTKNDFELVIRASKELEHILKTEFGSPEKDHQGKPNGLQALIYSARVPGTNQALPEPLQRKMRLLGTVRNKLVHNYSYNAIERRQEFIQAFVEAESQMKQMIKAARGEKESSCVVS